MSAASSTLPELAGAVLLSGILYVVAVMLLDRLNLYNARTVMTSDLRAWFAARG